MQLKYSSLLMPARYLLLLFLLLVNNVAVAHVAGVTDTGIKISRDSLTLVYTVPADNLSELERISTVSLEQSIRSRIADGFVVKNAGQLCSSLYVSARSLEAINSRQFEYKYDCHGLLTTLSIEYNLFFDSEKTHENFARISLLNRTQNITFSNSYRTHTIGVEEIVRRLAEARESNREANQSRGLSYAHYFPVGLKHIVLGYDHVLFLLALLLVPLTFGRLLVMVTTFTVAHSITLALSVLDIISVAPVFVEVVIAFSIVYVAFESFVLSRRSTDKQIDTATWSRRLATTFLFGLIHGCGFSYILKQMGLGDQILGSLLFFNIGVEVGQVLIILLVLPLITLICKRYTYTRCVPWLASFIGAAGLYWLVERLSGLI